ncbi:MAG: glycosyl transferase [Alphaproteobacteria bacterium]
MLAGLGLATTILIGVEARLAKTDAVLLMTAVACFGALARAYLRAVRVPDAGMPSPVTKAAQPTGHALPWIVPAVFWTALAASVLVKGPVVPILVALTMLVLVGIDRKAGWLRALKPGPGLLWFALLILPWFIAILSKAGDAFLAESVQKDMLAKVFGAQESHGAPPGYYTLLVWFTFWPSSVVILMALRGLWVSRRQPALRFLLAWVLPGWLFFELVATKLPHYVLPLYPALAILAALTVERRSLVTSGILALARFLWPGLAALLAAGGLVGGLILGTPVVLFAIPLVALAVGCGALAARRLSPSHAHRADPEGAMLLAMAASIAVTATVFGVVLPAQERLFPSRAAAALVRSVSCDAPKLVSAGFSEPSLVFNTTTATKLTGGAGAADFLGGEGCRLALVESRQERPFAERAAALGLTVATLGRVEGINLSNGRTVILTLYRRVNG